MLSTVPHFHYTIAIIPVNTLYSHISDLFLPTEIILLIIEEMEYDPRLLMCISKVSVRLINIYENGFMIVNK